MPTRKIRLRLSFSWYSYGKLVLRNWARRLQQVRDSFAHNSTSRPSWYESSSSTAYVRGTVPTIIESSHKQGSENITYRRRRRHVNIRWFLFDTDVRKCLRRPSRSSSVYRDRDEPRRTARKAPNTLHNTVRYVHSPAVERTATVSKIHGATDRRTNDWRDESSAIPSKYNNCHTLQTKLLLRFKR